MAGFITGSDVKTLFTLYNDNMQGVSDSQVLNWVNYLNQFLYKKLVSANPEKYLSTYIIKTISGTSSYAKPSDFRPSQVAMLYETYSGSDYQAINYDAQTANFTVGATLTGGTSGATGTISYSTDYGTTGTLSLSSVTGDFVDNEVISDSSGGSATSNGAPSPFSFSDSPLAQTAFGSLLYGFWTDGTNLNFTPTPQANRVYAYRYTPKLAKITSLSTETVIPTPEYDEFVRNSIDVYFQQYRRDDGNEILSSQRTEAALFDLLSDLSDTPMVINGFNSSSAYTGINRYRWYQGYPYNY